MRTSLFPVYFAHGFLKLIKKKGRGTNKHSCVYFIYMLYDDPRPIGHFAINPALRSFLFNRDYVVRPIFLSNALKSFKEILAVFFVTSSLILAFLLSRKFLSGITLGRFKQAHISVLDDVSFAHTFQFSNVFQDIYIINLWFD